MANTATITMFRYDPSIDLESRFIDYEVPLYENNQIMSVLKALHYINKNLDPIGYDFTCRCAFCGRCAMLINGAPSLACTTRIEAGQTYTLEPLTGFPVIKDLVVDTTRTYKKFLETKMTLKTKSGLQKPQPQEPGLWWDDLKDLGACRECMLCYVACPVIQEEGKWESFIGPGAMMQVAYRHIDPEDTDDRLRQAANSGVFECTLCGKCLAVCSASIQIPKLMKKLQTEAEAAGLKHEGEPTPAWPLI